MSKKLTTEQFIQKAIKVHGNKYNYSMVEYLNAKTKVIIICPEHEEFTQTPDSHLFGKGCPDCGGSKQLTNKTFIEKANLIHNDKYQYYFVDYSSQQTKINIFCPIHEEFKQTPHSHLKGRGCQKCAYENLEGGYQLSKAIKGYYKGSGYLYIIKMFNDEESFIKIGISKNLKQRLSYIKSQSKYNIEIIKTKLFDDFNQAIIKEDHLHTRYLKHSYLPKNKFNGRYECFNENILN